jgi:restriction system protein
MPIPTYDQLLWPILELAAQQPITRGIATKAVCDFFKLTEEERVETIPSGGATTIGNRAGWAMSHLTKAALIHKVAKFTYAATDKGRDYLKTHSGPITTADLESIEGFSEAWEEGSRKRAQRKAGLEPEGPANEVDTVATVTTATPDEMIDDAFATLTNQLRGELLDQLKGVNPYRFEQIVIDLLFAMGYGGSREEAALVTKKSGDEGIDGIINEDRLGLDVIYVQAKRWQATVGRGEIQNFVGALVGKHAHKGVFITTSDFHKTALEYARNVQHKVILISGQRLAELMIEYGVGVSTVRSIALKRVDSDYFED